MKSRILAILLIISLIPGFVFANSMLFPGEAKAASAESSIYIDTGTTTMTVGQTFTATFTVKSTGDQLGFIYGSITYDPAILSCNSYYGTIPIGDTVPGDANAVDSWSVSYTFKIEAAGQSSLSASFFVETLCTGEEFNNVASSVVITGKTPYIASDNCALNSLLTSEGYMDVSQRSYTINVPYMTNTFAINPSLADPKAKWGIVSGSAYLDNLAVGTSTIVLRVTAEDGVTYNDYTFHVVRARDPESLYTPAPTPTPKPVNSPIPTPSPVPEKVIEVKVGDSDKTFVIVNKPDPALPSMFHLTVMKYGEEEISAAADDEGKMTLVCLKDEEDRQAWYIYEGETKSFVPCDFSSSVSKSLIVKDLPADAEIPVGYISGTTDFSDNSVTCFVSSSDKNEMILYAAGSDYEFAFYRYNSGKNLFYPFIQDRANESVAPEITVTPSASATAEPKEQDTSRESASEEPGSAEQKEDGTETSSDHTDSDMAGLIESLNQKVKKQEKDINTLTWLVLILCCVSVVLLIPIVILLIWNRRKDRQFASLPQKEPMQPMTHKPLGAPSVEPAYSDETDNEILDDPDDEEQGEK